MHPFIKALLIWTGIVVAALGVGLAFGYAVDVGGKLTPARLRLAETLERGQRTSERLIGTLDDMINMNCTWSK